MPGRTAAEAVAAFLEPLREALRVLDAVTHLSTSPKGGYRRGVRYSWVLNGGRGVDLGPAGTFSPVTRAHLHLPPDYGRHYASDRMTLEKAIQWCAQHGAPLTCDAAEAADRLVELEAPHRLHRTWT